MSFDEKDAVNPLGISGGDGKQIYLRVGPAEPLTPPMTPDMAQKPTATTADSNKFQPFPVAEIQRPASAASDYSDKSIEEARPVAEEKIAGVTSIGGAAVGKQSRAGVLESIRIFLITLGTWMYNIFGGGLRATYVLSLYSSLKISTDLLCPVVFWLSSSVWRPSSIRFEISAPPSCPSSSRSCTLPPGVGEEGTTLVWSDLVSDGVTIPTHHRIVVLLPAAGEAHSRMLFFFSLYYTIIPPLHRIQRPFCTSQQEK